MPLKQNILSPKIHSTVQFSKELGPLAPLILFTIVMPIFGTMLLVSTLSTWFPWLESLQSSIIPVYVALTIFLAGLSLLPTHATSLIGGMLFGFVEGSMYALCAVVGASYLGFILISLLVKETTYKAILKHPRAANVHKELLKKGHLKAVWLVSLIRLSPVMPFAATNVLLAAAKVKPVHFLVGSFIGLAPRVIIVATAGAGLAELDLSQGSNIGLAILGGVATVLLIFYVGLIFKRVNKNLLHKEK